jgi:hypothetical protein
MITVYGLGIHNDPYKGHNEIWTHCGGIGAGCELGYYLTTTLTFSLRLIWERSLVVPSQRRRKTSGRNS